jgi:hypothetical protein
MTKNKLITLVIALIFIAVVIAFLSKRSSASPVVEVSVPLVLSPAEQQVLQNCKDMMLLYAPISV